MNKTTIPYAVLSNKQAEKLLGISVKQKKEQTNELCFTTLEYKGLAHYSIDSRENNILLRQAILEAITSPYLRGVIAIFFGRDGTVISSAQVKQNPITELELKGIITTCYEEMARHLNQKFIVSFKERKETHMIEGSGFSQFMVEKSEECNHSEILVINVHHDYIRVYSNLQDETLLLDLLIEMEEKA
jgi:hypothetical protein